MFRILIAEDDKGTRRLMENTLADAGYEPISAADGQEALELLTKNHVDLLILDAMMPRLDGFALLALLRRAQAISSRRLTVGGTTLVYDDLAVEWSGTVTDLPRKEFQLLYKLLSCPDKTFTRRQLMDEIWDLATDSDEHTVNVHINRLRDRFKENPDFSIVTVRGLGYKAVRL